MNVMKLPQMRSLVARFGVAGVMFFTLKGVAWLLLPVLLGWLVQ